MASGFRIASLLHCVHCQCRGKLLKKQSVFCIPAQILSATFHSFSGHCSLHTCNTNIVNATFSSTETLTAHHQMCLNVVRGMAGHSHWQNIKHDKANQDKKVAALRNKYASLIKGAIQEGGKDPKNNPNLAKIIARAEKDDVPKKSIQHMLKAAGQQNATIDVEVTGPAGSVFVVQVFAKSHTEALSMIASTIKKHGAQISQSRMAGHVFDHKGVVTVEVLKEDRPINMDKYLEVAIEVGAEDVIVVQNEANEPQLQFHCNVQHLDSVQKNLQNEGVNVLSSEAEYIPLTWANLSEQELKTVEHMLERLTNMPDVAGVFDNVSPPEE